MNPECPEQLEEEVRNARYETATSACVMCNITLPYQHVLSRSCFSSVFQTLRPLAYHSECLVTIASVKSSGLKVVVKSYIRNKLSQTAQEQVGNICEPIFILFATTHSLYFCIQVSTEIELHGSLSHPHIVRLLLAFEDSGNIYIVLEHADGGDLRKHLPALNEKRIRDFLVRPLLGALAHLQQEVCCAATELSYS